MLSNQEIVLYVIDNFNIIGMCYSFGAKRDVDDLQQIVLEVLLNYDNKLLNNIYNNGALSSFIWNTIRNNISRNRKSEWKMLNQYCDLPDDTEIEYDQYDEHDEKELMLKFIDEEFKYRYQQTVQRMNYNEKELFGIKQILKMKIYKELTLTDISNRFGFSRNVANNCVQKAKIHLKEKYEIWKKNQE